MVRAKKGDYRAFGVTHAFVALHGPSGSHSTIKLERVTKATRDGQAKESVHIFSGSYAPTRGVAADQRILRRETIHAEAMERALKTRGDDEFPTWEALKAFLRPFRRST